MPERTILLVEDNPDEVELTLRAFKKSKIPGNVVVARSGEEALDYLFGQGAHAGRDIAATPAVVLLDLNLPKISGLEVLRRLRADSRTQHVPVAILTASEADKDMMAGYDLGANSFLVKPIDFSLLSEAIPPLQQEEAV